MKKIKESKVIYDKIIIPDELDMIVRKTIEENNGNSMVAAKNPGSKKFSAFKLYTAVAAAVILIFITALNTNRAFAEGVTGIPIIGQFAKVLTVRSYTKVEDNTNISVNMPAIDLKENQENTATEGTTSDTSKDDEKFVADINSEITKIVDQYTTDAEARREADKEAFLATGGTKEEWDKKKLDINVNYEVKYQQDEILSLVLNTDESWYGAYNLKYYYNLNLKENRELTLKDLLGEDYQKIANDSIVKQMKDRVAQNKDYVYWGVAGDNSAGITGFTSVDENTKFYINQDGKPVVCFAKYDVAPGFMGAQEFVIE